jgi:RsiW-degrading membrane proteinase PrsW (M82 family)
MLYIIDLHIGVAVLLVYLFLRNGRAHREPKKALVEAVGLGVLGNVAALILELWLVPARTDKLTNYVSNHDAHATLLAVWSFLLVALIEEVVKFFPLTWLVYKRPFFNEHTDGVLYFGFAGMAFGLVENILYTVAFGTAAGVERLFLTPYFHAALTGIAGFYIASRKIRNIPMWRVVLAISTLILLHGFYDFAVGSGSVWLVLMALVVTVALVIGLFWYMRRARKLDQRLAIAPIHIDRFCPHCGRPNVHKTRFCEYCGQLVSN